MESLTTGRYWFAYMDGQQSEGLFALLRMFIEFPCGSKRFATFLTFVLIGLCHAFHLLIFTMLKSNRYAAGSCLNLMS